MCEEPDCRACRLVPIREHPDVEWLPEVKIDAARDLQRRLALAPYEGAYRVAILPDFHNATLNAANAMLKTLEEAPAHAVLLLTAISPESVLPTVKSRCEVLQLRPVPTEEMRSALESLGLEEAPFLAAIAGGRPGRALRYARDSELLAGRRQALEGLIEILRSSRTERFQAVNDLIGKGKLPEQRRRLLTTLEHWLEALRDSMYAGYEANYETAIPDFQAELLRASTHIAPKTRYMSVHAIAHSLDDIRHNANLRLALEALLMRLPKAA